MMKLEKFKEKDNKKIGIIVFTVCCVFFIAGVFLYKTFALFETKDNLNIIEGQVQGVGDLYFAFYVDDVISLTMPGKNDGYVLDSSKSTCNNGATPELNQEDWSIKVNNFTQSRTKCTLYFKTHSFFTEPILNGADPALAGSLIPITIANDGVVTKADTSKEWYNYTNKEWANAVILMDESVTYQNGETIPESNIESYFVWIPRYKYKIFNEGNYSARTNVETRAQSIEIEFEPKSFTASTGKNVGTWLTHPAFTAFDTNGMWIGKFETSKSLGNDNERNGEAVQIKPNVSSWRNIQIGNAFYTSFDYKRDLDSHMTKNTEWGAVAYLQHSVYGSGGTVRINNNSSYITGYAANNEPTCGYTASNAACNIYCNDGTCNKSYNTATGYLASTTANITGIYDMAGGAWEYMMGVMLDQSGKPMSGTNNSNHSGFKGSYGEGGSNTTGYDWPEKKYYDTYAYSTDPNQFQQRILGDATGEMGPFGKATHLNLTREIGSWHSNFAYNIYTEGPWYARGGFYTYGLYTGPFAFTPTRGTGGVNGTFRIILIP